jgi:hypothetical protein
MPGPQMRSFCTTYIENLIKSNIKNKIDVFTVKQQMDFLQCFANELKRMHQTNTIASSSSLPVNLPQMLSKEEIYNQLLYQHYVI